MLIKNGMIVFYRLAKLKEDLIKQRKRYWFFVGKYAVNLFIEAEHVAEAPIVPKMWAIW